MTRQQALSLIRSVARRSVKVIFTEHALEQMEERRISDLDVLRALLRGKVKVHPELDEYDNWVCRVEHNTSDFRLVVIIAICGTDETKKTADYLVVITAFDAG